jgi:glycogen operon protein
MGTGTHLPLGATLAEGGINIAVVSRHADRVVLCLFDETGERETHRFALPERLGDVHYGFLSGAEAGARYGLRAEGPWDPAHGHRFDPAKLLVDPYAKLIDRPFIHRDELRAPPAARIDTAPWVPKAILRPPARRTASLSFGRPGFIYELAIRSFTRRHPDIPEEIRGTARALCDPRVIDHLTKLGADTVELMPVAAWIDERHLPALGLHNAWGYNPIVFMAPDPRLAADGIDDIKAAVNALHTAGIRVLLDVVYNHTGESDAQGTTLSLRGLDNALYYRHARDGTLVNDTGCGNTLALDRGPVVQLIMDSLRYWAESTGIDGFRFDLATTLGRTDEGFNPNAPLLAAIDQDPVLSSLTLIAEPWDAGPGGYRLGQFPPDWLEWNDRYRNDVRRFWRGDRGVVGALATRLAGSSDVFGSAFRRPSASVNYVASHDGYTLRDVATFASKRNEANGEDNQDGDAHEVSWSDDDPARAVRNLLATLFLSRGTPMLAAGDEFGRTQNGNNNAYAQDNETTWLDWRAADGSLFAFVAELAHLRRSLPAFSSDRFLTETDATWLRPDGLQMGQEDWNDGDRHALGLMLTEGDDRVLLWLNSGTKDLPVTMPQAHPGYCWVAAFSTGEPSETLSARSVTLFTGQRHGADYDDTLRRLASEVGIDLDWWEVDGTHHAVSPDTLKSVLAAMRVPAASRAEAEETLARVTAERHRELPLSLVIKSGEEYLLEPSPRRRMLHILTDAKESLRLEGRPGEPLRLSSLPIGFHECWFEDAPDERTRLIVGPGRCYLPVELSGAGKYYGFAAHLYALRREGDQGIGDFETLARFGEASARAGGIVAGINPIHMLFPSDRQRVSPYQPSDRRFIDPIYIDITGMLAEWLLPRAKRMAAEKSRAFDELRAERYVNYPGVWNVKAAILREAFAEFPGSADFESFINTGGEPLSKHGLFETLASVIGLAGRCRWPRGVDLARFAEDHREEIRFHLWLQWIAERQFASAAKRAGAAGLSIGFYRDFALGTAFEGGEVWSNPECFAGSVSLGAPPDPFARDGQIWNLPPQIPRALEERGFDPFISALSANMRHAGALRIDHILGYARQFWIPQGASGSDGAYVRFPADALIAITAIESHRHSCMAIGEDLGTVPEGLRQTLADADILSYRVLWFERDATEFRPPGAYPRLSTSCLGLHDLPTFIGWSRNAPAVEREALASAIRREGVDPGQSEEDLLVAAHEFVARSGSALMLVQVDDLQGETEPLNVPGTDRDRPNWRRRNRANVEELGSNTRVIEAVKRGRSK